MATLTAWTARYSHVLQGRLGLQVTPRASSLSVTDGHGWTHHLTSNPRQRPDYLRLTFAVRYLSHHQLLQESSGLLPELAEHLTRTGPVAAFASGPTDCTFSIHAHLAAPGVLPTTRLLASTLPTYLSVLVEAHEQLVTELDAALLYQE